MMKCGDIIIGTNSGAIIKLIVQDKGFYKEDELIKISAFHQSGKNTKEIEVVKMILVNDEKKIVIATKDNSMKTDFITLFKFQNSKNAYFSKLFQISNGERRTTDIVYSEDADELYHVDNDRTKFKSNIRVLNVKNLEVKRVLCKNVVFTNSLYLDNHPYLWCGGFGTSDFRVLDPETG